MTSRLEDIFTRIRAGSSSAHDELLPIIYDELKRVARSFMKKEREGHTLQTTALVNEACIKLLGMERVDWVDRAHFVRVAARAMRRILVDHARARNRDKRGAGAMHVPLEALELQGASLFDYAGFEFLSLHRALEKLATVDPRKAQVVELLYFGGLTRAETAKVLGVVRRTVDRDWRYARLWIIRELESSGD